MDNFKRLLENMVEKNIPASLFMENKNIFYLTEFNPSSFAVLVMMEEPVLYVNKMDLEEANNFSKVPVEEFKSFKELKSFISDLEISKLVLEDSLSLGIFNKIKGPWNFSCQDLISPFRRIKSSNEINKIKKSLSIAEKSIKQIDIRGNEWEVAAELDYVMKKNGSQKTAFETIVASGPRSSLPHARPSKNLIDTPVMIDWGAVFENYCSDLTRTIVKTEKQEEIKNILLEAQKEGINSISPGVPVSEIDSVVRNVITEYGYGDNFIHSTGHGVGLEVHEAPSLSIKDDSVLEKNMVITIEPGIYLEGEFGVRVEDMVIVKNQAKVLSKLSHDLY
ncbi:aminopeptidase P family protein [Methanobacterium alcaliphilum]|uniref:aminopeptidase P family protein n=1 Tax=Methanobacterium alcaliphilum TaxID=392018 RepID=UPI00200AB55B|nr:aminopeptidase P family protein [Methanobacterium alcaliphilum]MCK9150341.1 aminopeptidase P family protein [Methanobacterium alcaliphilum]